jgi:bifunctional non-homologous end joining protein LigD
VPKSDLRTYRAKRDFERTSEPAGEPGPAIDQAADAPRFVVQEHDATRLHWDLRLEHDGTLASWAIPNGIPADPADNRLAVHTEDHPLEYLEFEGEIPKGEYGAGTMKVWDRGTYELHKWQDRKVEVTFHGERLRGRYGLFPIGHDGDSAKDWMIHRMDPPTDPAREPMPEHLLPMLARSGDLPKDPTGWEFEVKWDGVRAIAYVRPGRLRLESRNLNDISDAYPEVRGLLRQLGMREAVFDGEIIAFDESGRPSFGRLQSRMHLASSSAIRRRMADTPVVYAIFDLLHLDGHSLLDLPYSERRKRLEALGLSGPAWRVPARHGGDGTALLEATRKQGLEGVLAKRSDSRYEPARRTTAWVKVKHTQRQELVIGGWLPGEGRRSERIGALLVGYPDGEYTAGSDSNGANEAPAEVEGADGKATDANGTNNPDSARRLRYAGRVGTGFTDATLDDLTRRLAPLRRRDNPFDPRPKLPRNAVFVDPSLVAEIEFANWTSDGIMRAPSFKGLRNDKPAREVVRERSAHTTSSLPPDDPEALFDEVSRLPDGSLEVLVEGRRLKLSNWDKVLFPKTGFTKGNLIAYYARIAPAVLPHLRDRPLTLKRYPNGVEEKYFYEKQAPSHRPEWVQTARVGSIDYVLAQDRPTLVWLANLADIELHTSLALARSPDDPTMMVFDLDPGEGAGILECGEVALVLNGLFEQLRLTSVAKTSGSKGMQVYVPVGPGTTYDHTKPFARRIAELLEQRLPALVVSRMTKKLRAGKVLVDWSQNDEHKTTVTVYSVRARERPTVSTPVSWDEVQRARDESAPELLSFDTEEVLARAEERGERFAPALVGGQELPSL